MSRKRKIDDRQPVSLADAAVESLCTYATNEGVTLDAPLPLDEVAAENLNLQRAFSVLRHRASALAQTRAPLQYQREQAVASHTVHWLDCLANVDRQILPTMVKRLVGQFYPCDAHRVVVSACVCASVCARACSQRRAQDAVFANALTARHNLLVPPTVAAVVANDAVLASYNDRQPPFYGA